MTDNKNISTELIQEIEKFYNMKINKISAAPRQFVAKTYVLEDFQQTIYFCKVVNNSQLIPVIIKTLHLVEQMASNGIDRISYPIRGIEGLYIIRDNTLIFLLNYIPAKQGFDYDPFVLGELVAKIHSILPEEQTDVPKETFQYQALVPHFNRFEDILKSKSSDEIQNKLKELLVEYEKEIRHHWNEFTQICEKCNSQLYKPSITHGDIATNILVKAPKDIYIIDWDELRIAPGERDLWMLDDNIDFMAGYMSIRQDFSTNKDFRKYFILQYYFERMDLYFLEILNEKAYYEHRLQCIQKLSKGRLAGWRLPKVQEVSPF